MEERAARAGGSGSTLPETIARCWSSHLVTGVASRGLALVCSPQRPGRAPIDRRQPGRHQAIASAVKVATEPHQPRPREPPHQPRPSPPNSPTSRDRA